VARRPKASTNTEHEGFKMSRNLKFTILSLLCFCMAPPLSAQSGDAPEFLAPAVPVYVIQPNDILEIFAWKDPSLTRKVLVRPDGRISFPLIQDMQAAGLNPGEVKQEIERKLKEYYDVPNVTVIIDTIQSYRVFVTGKVGKSG